MIVRLDSIAVPLFTNYSETSKLVLVCHNPEDESYALAVFYVWSTAPPLDFSLSFLQLAVLTLEVGAEGVNGQQRPQS